MRGTLRFLGALVATNLKASMALRGAFFMQVVFMLFNNLIFFVTWWIFFDRFKSVNGWDLRDMAAIYAVCAIGFGLSVVFGEGARHLARQIIEGELDSFLAQPKPPLLQAVASRSMAAGWGDIVTGFLLMALGGYASPLAYVMLIVASLCAGLMFLASTVIFHSSAFWLSGAGDIARQFSDFLLMFSLFPKTVFGGFLKVLLYTVIPAGFISYVPVELVRGFNVPMLLASVGGVVVYSAIALLVFRLGLRRYESGSRFGVRA
ncbi:MAG: ABC transporter permease [Planctomycetota bacterium]|jgi:ABC-2 type transport system permease protein